MADILSLFVSSEVALSFIKKTAKVTYVLFIVNLAVAFMSLAEWYFYIQHIPAGRHPHAFYNYTVWPVMYIADILAVVAGSFYNYKGFALLKDINETGNDVNLSKAFRYFYMAFVIFLIGSGLLLIDNGYRLYIH